MITGFGKNKEQFLNLALQRNVDIYDGEWHDNDEPLLTAKVEYHEVGRLRRSVVESLPL